MKNKSKNQQMAERAYARLALFDNSDLRDQIVETASCTGAWQVWLKAFSKDADMKKRLTAAWIKAASDAVADLPDLVTETRDGVEAEAVQAAEQWVSVEQIAQHLNVKTFTIYKWLERKEMPAHKAGRLWRFKISEIDQWVRDGNAGA